MNYGNFLWLKLYVNVSNMPELLVSNPPPNTHIQISLQKNVVKCKANLDVKEIKGKPEYSKKRHEPSSSVLHRVR